MSAETGIAYMAVGRLLLDPPGRLIFHTYGHGIFPTYPGSDPERPNVGIRTGIEKHWTRCGLTIYEEHDHNLDGIRLDNARLVGRPCRRCFR